MIMLLTPDLGNITIRYIHFFSSISWWGIMFFMFFIIFPLNKDGRYSALFPRVQRFMKIIASVGSFYLHSSIQNSPWKHSLIVNGARL
jgi:uncharacterized membrane protein